MKRPIELLIDNEPARKLATDLRCTLAEAAELLEALLDVCREEEANEYKHN